MSVIVDSSSGKTSLDARLEGSRDAAVANHTADLNQALSQENSMPMCIRVVLAAMITSACSTASARQDVRGPDDPRAVASQATEARALDGSYISARAPDRRRIDRRLEPTAISWFDVTGDPLDGASRVEHELTRIRWPRRR
jgi:hypothetical protein